MTGDMNHIMKIKIGTFSDGHEVFDHKGVDRIENEDLFIFTNAADGFSYRLIRLED